MNIISALAGNQKINLFVMALTRVLPSSLCSSHGTKRLVMLISADAKDQRISLSVMEHTIIRLTGDDRMGENPSRTISDYKVHNFYSE